MPGVPNTIRTDLVNALRKDLLGPRDGPREELDGAPDDEYLLGMLEPKDLKRSPLMKYFRSDTESEEDTAGEDDDADYARFNPMAAPKSIGISFGLKSEGLPLISVCATWGRYTKNAAGKWKRKAHGFIAKDLDVSAAAGALKAGEGVTLHLRSFRAAHGGFHVSVYLVNSTEVEKDAKYAKPEEIVFQPQIRVLRGNGVSVVPLSAGQAEDLEEAAMSTMYERRTAIARGHMCSAVWRDVDPEYAWGSVTTTKVDGNPFVWDDGLELWPGKSGEFSPPDLRTEFMPCYFIPQAQMPSETQLGTAELDADKLADITDSARLTSALNPLADSYEDWIRDSRTRLAGHKPDFRSANLDECDATAHRIREGIELLRGDEDARLSFAFMNKAMSIQATWKGQPGLTWRLFQLAFVLQCIPSIVKSDHPDRKTCDILWFPTGGGKTEAYLGLSMFTLAYRRRRARTEPEDGYGYGTAVISRYTLRLLTIQQFRRTLSVITAAELLRVTGWRPADADDHSDALWGSSRFSLGLWVGGEVTPNELIDWTGYNKHTGHDETVHAATGILRGRPSREWSSSFGRESEPAQVLECPACKTLLSVTDTNLQSTRRTVYWMFSGSLPKAPSAASLSSSGFAVTGVSVSRMPNGKYWTLGISFTPNQVKLQQFEQWWRSKVVSSLPQDARLQSARAARPGYFIREWGVEHKAIDYEIHCINPGCQLNRQGPAARPALIEWSESVPTSGDENPPAEPLPPFALPGKHGKGWGVPVPAYPVDAQVFARCTSIVIATVDKFARLAYEPRAGAMYGNVTKFDDKFGFFREEAPPERQGIQEGTVYDVKGFPPPELIIQDELHLIEGPLGSMVGLYETAIETLALQRRGGAVMRPKYIASSATVRHADSQVLAVFDRSVRQFPPSGISVESNFFAESPEVHPLDTGVSGRLYLAVCTPGQGPQTPVARIWSVLLQSVYEISKTGRADPNLVDKFWTVVGYFNALKDLASAERLYDQDIRLRWLDIMADRHKAAPRPLGLLMELSSNTNSADLPGELSRLASPDGKVDGVFCTSMFGTGVDVDRLGLMVMHGQPKTTANYIQATGRVGRQTGGLVVTFLWASKPRDLDHYEFFVGYHRALHRYVEPITVYPFSPSARERALGPVSVALLRNARSVRNVMVTGRWGLEEKHTRRKLKMSHSRNMRLQWRNPEVDEMLRVFEDRAQKQPSGRIPKKDTVKSEISAKVLRWKILADTEPGLLYWEAALSKPAESPVVLGDPQHEGRFPTAFKNAPQSLRDVEPNLTLG